MTSPRLPVFDRRRAGVLLHLSSLEAALGRGGRAFIDWLGDAGFSVWQFLPLGPTGTDGSPYWVRSDSAGNTAFIDQNELPSTDSGEYPSFLENSRGWLDDYVEFEALSAAHRGEPWWTWPAEHRDREPAAMERARKELAPDIERLKKQQFTFAWQWARLREHAHSRGVRLFGDLPFYVAPDSAETWAHPEQFQLDGKGRATAVAGVPPDYFSETGQLWGNPLYDWRVMRHDNFGFWRARVHHQLARVDLLRIDHFRALAAHWSVPAGAPDARGGTWKRTPGRTFLKVLREECGDLPIVAEDLGVITPDVEALRKGYGLPGMRVLQFAFGGDPNDVHLPHMHERDCIVYTGTHDNDTTVGWFLSLDGETLRRVEYFLRLSREAGDHSDAGCARARLRSASQHPGHRRWQLELAPATGFAHRRSGAPARVAEQGSRPRVTSVRCDGHSLCYHSVQLVLLETLHGGSAFGTRAARALHGRLLALRAEARDAEAHCNQCGDAEE